MGMSCLGKVLQVFLIEDDERHWVCANDEEDARAVYREAMGPPEAVQAITRLDPTERLKIKTDTDEGEVEKTCAEWAAKEGRGLLASTVF